MKARFLSLVCGAAVIALLVLTMSATASAKETRVHEFPGGIDPVGLVADRAGNLYGTTGSDGFYGRGTVFQVHPSNGGIWTESAIYSFSGGSDGGNPEAVMALDAHGNLYGTTQYGGSATCACGTVFELSPSAGGVWKEATLYSFAGGADGASPRYTNLVFDAAGNLYGVTEFGGSSLAGTVFELSPQAGGGWTESVLYTFAGGTSDGANPLGGLVFDKAGNLYGSANSGGSRSAGADVEVFSNYHRRLAAAGRNECFTSFKTATMGPFPIPCSSSTPRAICMARHKWAGAEVAAPCLNCCPEQADHGANRHSINSPAPTGVSRF